MKNSLIIKKFRIIRENIKSTMYNSASNIFTESRMKKVTLMFLLTLLSFQVFAAGNIDNGKIISYTCTGCHGIPFYKNAAPVYHVPRIGGQNESYIASALKSYRAGDRSHPTMKVQAASLSDQDIADISAYFASLK